MNCILYFFYLVLLCLCWTPLSPAHESLPDEIKDFSSCLMCHEGIEKLDENHAFSCDQCHILPENRHKPLANHDLIVRFPAAPSHAKIFCGSCHQNEISRLYNSLHYTLAGIINQTRYLWGAQKDPDPQYSASGYGDLKGLPPDPSVVQTPADLVDDLLRRRCITCHPGKKPPQERGLYRGLGCAACHILYENDGVYRGRDQAMKGRKGYPKVHKFCNPIPVRQCLHCHNGPRVGADYTGLFEHDYHQSYRYPISRGMLPERIYLMDHHRLKPDFHYEKGLLCVDCHEKGDVMGRGEVNRCQQEAVRIRCQHCHEPYNNNIDESGKGQSHPCIEDGLFRSRQGRLHMLPIRDKSVKAHSIPQMKNVHCIGCHSAWSFSDYGPSLLRDDRRDLSQWAPWRLQSNSTINDLFDEQGRFLGPVSGPGPWFLGWRFRRWEFLTLGKDSKGRIVPFRPRYQFLISFIDKNGRVILDSVIPQRGDGSGQGWAYMPFYPHTVQKRGRPCEACHGQPLAAGQGIWKGQGQDLLLTRPSPPVYPSLKLLSESEKTKLLQKTPIYRKWRFRTLWQDFND